MATYYIPEHLSSSPTKTTPKQMPKPPQNHPKTTLFTIISLLFCATSYGVGVIIYERYYTLAGSVVANVLLMCNMYILSRMLSHLYEVYTDNMDEQEEQEEQAVAPTYTQTMQIVEQHPLPAKPPEIYVRSSDLIKNAFFHNAEGEPVFVTANHVTTKVNAMPDVVRGENGTCYIPLSTLNRCLYSIGSYLYTYERLPNGNIAKTENQLM